MTTRLLLVHATPVAMAPVHAAFAEAWPQAELVNLLDDGLTSARARDVELTPALSARFAELVRYGCRDGADQVDGVLITCSAFGPAIEAIAASTAIPVLKPNEAMFQDALARGKRIGMLATFGPALVTMEAEFAEEAARLGSDATLTTVLVPNAIDLLRRGDADSHNRLVAERAHELAGCDAIMLAHFSTSRAAAAVRARVDVPVLSAPGAAVARLKALLM